MLEFPNDEQLHTELISLTPQRVVQFVSGLLYAEAGSKLIPKTAITIDTNIYKADGGIDASVDNGIGLQDDIIKEGNTVYQIKSQNFERTDKELEKELFGKEKGRNVAKSHTWENLKPMLKKCAERNSHYVLISAGETIGKEQRDQAKAKLSELFTEALRGKENCSIRSVDVWGANQLIRYLKEHPAILRGMDCIKKPIWNTVSDALSWEQYKQEVMLEGEVKVSFDQIKSFLEDPSTGQGKRFMHVTGASGIGKSKLVLEAAKEEYVGSRAVFFEKAKEFFVSDEIRVLYGNPTNKTIWIIDECDEDIRERIWDRFGDKPVKILTIYNEQERSNVSKMDSKSIQVVEIPRLSDEVIREMIENYDKVKFSTDEGKRYLDTAVRLCEGYPRAARHIGENVRNGNFNVNEIPRSILDIWKSLIYGYNHATISHEEKKAINCILTHASMFSSVPFNSSDYPSRDDEKDFQSFVQFVQTNNKSIDREDIINSIHGLIFRKVLQNPPFLYITPKLIRKALQQKFIDYYGGRLTKESLQIIVSSDRLSKAFNRVIREMGSHPEFAGFVQDLHGIYPFDDGVLLLNKQGAELFHTLAETNPLAALDQLKRTIGTWPPEKIKNELVESRFQIVSTLQMIAMYRELYEDAVLLIGHIARGENHPQYANNSIGTLHSMFALSANTSAPLSQRQELIERLLHSHDSDERQLGIAGALSAIDEDALTWSYSQETTRPMPEPARPKTWGEVAEYFSAVLRLLLEVYPTEDEETKKDIRSAIVRESRSLYRFALLTEMLHTAWKQFANEGHTQKRSVLEAVETIIRFDLERFPPEIRQNLTALKDELTGSDFESRLRRYVGITLDEDRGDLEKHEYRSSNIPELAKLSQEIVNDPTLLTDELLRWLSSKEPQNSGDFGFQLAIVDTSHSLLDRLIKSQKEFAEEGVAPWLVIGYLWQLFTEESSRGLWWQYVQELVDDSYYLGWLHLLLARNGMTDDAASLLLEKVKSGAIPRNNFAAFTYSRSISAEAISEPHFHEFIKLLLHEPDNASTKIAFDLFYTRYKLLAKSEVNGADKLPDWTGQVLFTPEVASIGEGIAYQWVELVKHYCEDKPERELEVADYLLENFGRERGLIHTYGHSTPNYLDKLLQKHPHEIWLKIVALLGPPIDARAFQLRSWLHGYGITSTGEDANKPLYHVAYEDLWQWVEEDIELRAWYLASFVPRETPVPGTLSHDVLVRYGDRKDVQNNFSANYYSTGFSGSISAHYTRLKQHLEEMRKQVTDKNVLRWYDDYIARTEIEIAEAKRREEREEF